MEKSFITSKLTALLLSTVFLASCGNNSLLKTNTASEDTVNNEAKAMSPLTSDMITYDSDDYYSDWKNEKPSYIQLNETSINLKGSGAVVENNTVTITTAGVYAISGKLNKGQIIVDANDKDTVKLVLNGVEINNSDNAPIYVKNAGKTIITLEEGTKNLVTDGEKYVFSNNTTDEPNAAIFSKSNLTINGKGTLTVRGNYNNGITSKDDLKITGGNINIYSADDGLMGKDMVLVKDGNFTIEAGGDGIKSTNDTDTSKGFIALEGGNFNIKSGTDGIQAETALLITHGKYTIFSGGGSINSSDKSSDNNEKQWGMWDKNTAEIGNETIKSDETEAQSAKGLKASLDITISGGVFNIDSSDDAIHSNDTITILGEEISIASGDDGIHADSSITIKSGKINITKSYEGIESALINIIDGNIHIVAKDDGINVGGGKDKSAVQGRAGQNNLTSEGNNKLNISGGYISVDATGDGLDSNGSIYMTGGTVIVNGPTANNNGPLDYDGNFEISGGFLIAAGSSGMAQTPSEESTEYSVIMNYSKVQQAGTLVHIKDSKGNTVVTFSPKKEYQSVVISSPQLKKDTEYTIYSGGTSTGSVEDGLYKDGVYEGGSKLTSFTISSSVTWLSETGVTTKEGSNLGGHNNGKFNGKGNRPNK